MKIGAYQANGVGNVVDVKCFRPIQVLLFDVTTSDNLAPLTVADFLNSTIKVNVTLQDSKTGNQTSVVPFVKLSQLAEIATMHEGSVIMTKDKILFPVLLNPAANLRVDNDKYLEIELSGMVPGQHVDVYGFETENISDMLCIYQKFSIPVGTARQIYQVGTNDIIAFPTTGFDSVRFYFNSGVVSDMSPRELQYDMAKNNDLTLYQLSENGTVDVVTTAEDNGAGGQMTVSKCQMIMSHGNSFIRDLAGVKQFEIIRDSQPETAFEFLLGDLH